MVVDATLLISGWTAIAATFAAVIAWRVFRWQRQGDVPVVLCEVTSPRSESEWWEIKITVRNRTTTRWESKEARINIPKQAIGYSQYAVPITVNDYGDELADHTAARALATRVFPLKAKTEPVGTQPRQYLGGGDVSSERAYMYIPEGSPKLKMTLTLVSMDGKPKKFFVPIERDLTPS
ncbi:hypothetical protein [Qipengyuania atrilutea]|uniref:Uncharacterized protein n=1 Tax=Qipengyuania atrilutea TaxID=2744473 RepID=A0A850H5B6_9SPHN|nr:hypothetical protein [Actirhodobacter atriluteus]NVD44315.1 hypothetical protein [Actirhodobacter atriluteus]